LIADELLRLLIERGMVIEGISSRPEGKEVLPWRDDAEMLASLDHIDIDGNGESTWSMKEARKLLKRMQQKRKQRRSSGRSRG
jgi:hypothetical protein